MAGIKRIWAKYEYLLKVFRVDQIMFISVSFAKNPTASNILKFKSDNGNIQRYTPALKGKRLFLLKMVPSPKILKKYLQN